MTYQFRVVGERSVFVFISVAGLLTGGKEDVHRCEGLLPHLLTLFLVMVRMSNMNNVTPEQKQTLTKSLAVAGLLGIIILTAWLAIQIVQIFPSALSSLATIANSVYNYNPLQTNELSLSQTEVSVNSGVEFEVSWPKSDLAGTYTFSFECVDDITLDLRTKEKTFSDASCNQPYDLGDSNQVAITAITQEATSTDISYTISFYRPNSEKPTLSSSETVSVNSEVFTLDIDDTTDVTIKEDEDTMSTSTVAKEEIVSNTPVVATKPSKPTPVKPTSTPLYIYEIPSSNPAGIPDLAITYQGVGHLSANGLFTKTNVLKKNVVGAVQFTVHNIGNKTSDVWTYHVLFPNGNTYHSKSEKGLLPNERATITVQIPAVISGSATTLAVSVNTDFDNNTDNNTFNATAIVIE